MRRCQRLRAHPKGRAVKNYKSWQDGNDSRDIFLNDYFSQKLNYNHQDPVKAELVNLAEDYRCSSAIDYAGSNGLLNIEVVLTLFINWIENSENRKGGIMEIQSNNVKI